MSDSPYPLMAQQFIAMWQQQLAHMLADERFAHAMMDMMQQGNFAPFPMAEQTSHAQTDSHAPKPHATTQQPAPAPDAGSDVVVVLERRLAACEARLAAVESELAGYRSKR